MTVPDGIRIWRQRSAVNKHNPQGISLAAVDREIADAVNVRSAVMQLFLHDPVSSNSGLSYTSGGRLSVTLLSKAEADSAALAAGGEELADQIRANPLMLLQSPAAKTALAHWSYAAWYGNSQGTRDRGAALINRALVKRAGPRKRHTFHGAQLAQAYRDLVAYGDALIAARKATTCNDELRRFFPDCIRLAPDDAKILDEVHVRQYGTPRSSELAERYITLRTGMSGSTLHVRIDPYL